MELIEAERKEVESSWITTNLPLDDHCIRSGVILNHVERVIKFLSILWGTWNGFYLVSYLNIVTSRKILR